MHASAALICLSASANSQPTPAGDTFRQMQPQRLHQHHVRQLLRDQRPTRLWVAHLLLHTLERPPHGRLVGLLLNVHNRPQRLQQRPRMIAAQGKMSADQGASTFLLAGELTPQPSLAPVFKRCRPKRPVGRKAEGQPARQQKAVAGRRQHRIRNALDRQPAAARNHRIALDAGMLWPLNRPACRHAESARAVASSVSTAQSFLKVDPHSLPWLLQDLIGRSSRNSGLPV